ncbi:uncharacterized protein LOC131248373 [Magnolia sinica]|uniref:uncharacterized protein LOC131248373 n=1 Tax=Magnolia sinica TaxID=86752 RepID=UPI00265881B4|nr:uncharacterized protein LOC131248373 [Magnolia sinica]
MDRHPKTMHSISTIQMARSLLLARSTATGATQAGLGATAAFLMCASHAWRWRRHGPGPAIQLDMDARILTTKRVHQVQPGDDDRGPASGPQVSVWQKNILMGEKCQLRDFSGVIVYDSAGNLITDVK